jgi:predicted glycosyltransferase
VQAGGYNSFHEMRSVGLPTLFLPNMNTGMDDQLARCKVAEEEGWGLVLGNHSELKPQIQALLQYQTTPSAKHTNGAVELAGKLKSDTHSV